MEQRVEELADKPSDFKPKNAIGFKHLLPLSEIIAAVIDASSPSVRRVWNIYNNLIANFGNEYTVLIDASEEEVTKIADQKVAKAIIMVREGKARVTPGYDGVYGQLVPFCEGKAEVKVNYVPQRSLTEWCL